MKHILDFIPKSVRHLRDWADFVLKSVFDEFVEDTETALDSKLDQEEGDARYGQLGGANTWAATQSISTNAALPALNLQAAVSQTAPLQKFALPSSTGTVRDAASIDTVWTDSTDATRTSAVVISTVAGGALAEVVRFTGQADATNTLEFRNASGNSNPGIYVNGSPGNIGLSLRPKGNGLVDIGRLSFSGWWTIIGGNVGGINFGSDHKIVWGASATNTTASGTSGDVGLARSATGIVKTTNGSTGYGTLDALAYQASGTQVISSQQPAIADSDGSEADNARAINEILAAMRTHGLIATI